MISRRHLLAVAGAVPAAMMLADAAEAKPIVLTDTHTRTYGPVILIGDSLSGGYVGGLKNELVSRKVGPFRYDIQGSRSITRESRKFPSGVSAVKSARAAGFDPPAWVIALGGNDMWYIGRQHSVATRMIDEILGLIGADRTVFFVNQWSVKGGSFPIMNTALVDATARWPRLHVADWASQAKRHREWHGHDGTHYNLTGARARNTFLVTTMINATSASAAASLRSRQRPHTYVM